MHFLKIVGVTATNITFSIAFGFMDQEKKWNCVCALNYLNFMLDGYNIPNMIVMDRVLMNACEKVFI